MADLGDLLRELMHKAEECQCDSCRQERGLPPRPRRDIRELTMEEMEEMTLIKALRREAEAMNERAKSVLNEANARREVFWAKIDRKYNGYDKNFTISKDNMLQEVSDIPENKEEEEKSNG